jgi:hypothetical protein
MTVKTYDMHELMKSVLWEEAKGKLRAMIACDGALHVLVPPKTDGTVLARRMTDAGFKFAVWPA